MPMLNHPFSFNAFVEVSLECKDNGIIWRCWRLPQVTHERRHIHFGSAREKGAWKRNLNNKLNSMEKQFILV